VSGTTLTIQGLRGGYGDTVVLRGIDAVVKPGEVLGVLGRNGVGKTTLMRLLMGHLPSSGGRVEWQGRDLNGLAPHIRCRVGIAYGPQELLVFDQLSRAGQPHLASPRSAPQRLRGFVRDLPALA